MQHKVVCLLFCKFTLHGVREKTNKMQQLDAYF